MKCTGHLTTCLDPATSAFYGHYRRTTRGETMTSERQTAHIMRRNGPGFALALTVLLGACSGNSTPPITHGRGMSCIDDSAYCIGERKAALRHIVTRSDRHWIREPATVHAYASGVRLFAFKTKKKELTCDELRVGRHEADGAARVLRGPEGRSLSLAQISRGVMLGEEVSRELAREHARRCGRG